MSKMNYYKKGCKLLLVLLVTVHIFYSERNSANAVDCRRHIFHHSCRGITGKRSYPAAMQLSPAYNTLQWNTRDEQRNIDAGSEDVEDGDVFSEEPERKINYQARHNKPTLTEILSKILDAAYVESSQA